MKMEIRWNFTIIAILPVYFVANGEEISNTKLDLNKNNFSELANISITSTTSATLSPPHYDNMKLKSIDQSNQSHSRKKRLIWITDDGRLALPPGTALSITPSISLPLVRYPPDGFFSNLSISFPVTIDFDKLGLTDNQNPLGDLPPIFARSFGRAAGHMLGSYVSNYLNYRTKRDTFEQNIPKTQHDHKFHINLNNVEKENLQLPELPDKYKHAFHGGERALLYGAVEDLLTTFGINGKACLLRTICEVHSRSVDHLGLLGEATKLFLTASKSPFSDYIEEYVQAERIGEGKEGPGECFPYYKECPKGIFKSMTENKYSENEIKRDDKDESNDRAQQIQNTLSM